MITERKNNDKLISLYKENIDKLNKDLLELKIENEKYRKENIDLKNTLKSRKNDGLNRSHNSAYEDEIIIVNKEKRKLIYLNFKLKSQLRQKKKKKKIKKEGKKTGIKKKKKKR